MYQLLTRGPVVINIGIEDFLETLKNQNVPVTGIDWSPPAGGDPEMIEILDKIL